jgi:8-oxo-dGTP pyrophosphatase MutT (NUDIX family)
MIRAAGMMLITGPAGKALFLRRADTGLWAFPGGHIEAGETAEEAAEREVREEIGPTPHSNPKLWIRRIKTDDATGEEVDFTTFAATVNNEFIPTLDAEHTAWTWASVESPPEPLHPGAKVAIDRLTMDELGVARAMVAGDLTSPQQYGSFWLWSIRITGTGVAYRDSLDEWCYRPASVYLNDEFLARAGGLPVVFLHQTERPDLDSKEFNDRVVGTVFVPFLKNDEVWAVSRIYDNDAVDVLASGAFSTSPTVLFGKNSGNQTLKTQSGETLLIEGKPALLDSIALVPAGVWDKGGPAAGVSTIITEEPIGMTEEEMAAADKARKDSEAKLDAIMDAVKGMSGRLDAIEEEKKADRARKDAEEKERMDKSRKDAMRKDMMDRHRKDRFGHRKDGESCKDWSKRHDADEEAMCDAMRKDGMDEEMCREDAKRARRDCEEQERKDGGESFEKWAREESEEPAHKDRKDAEERARRDAMTTENADLKARLAAMEATLNGLATERAPEEAHAIGAAQARADAIAAQFGDKVPPPIAGETSLAYRRRLVKRFQAHSPRFKDERLDGLTSGPLSAIEDIVYADAMAAARNPATSSNVGRLIEHKSIDGAGRTITEFSGDPMAWMAPFMTSGRVGRFDRSAAQRTH